MGRAGLSVLANFAEGAGESSPGDKARFYRYSLRSASEFAAMASYFGGRAAARRRAPGS